MNEIFRVLLIVYVLVSVDILGCDMKKLKLQLRFLIEIMNCFPRGIFWKTNFGSNQRKQDMKPEL